MNNDYLLIKKFCQKHKNKYVLRKIINAFLLLWSLFLGVSFVLSVAFEFLPWTLLPVLFDLLFVLSVFVNFGIIVFYLTLGSPSLVSIAKKLEKSILKKHQSLSISLEFGSAKNSGSKELVNIILSQVQKTLKNYPAKLEKLIAVKRILGLLATGVCFIFSIYYFSSPMISWWDIPLSFFSSEEAFILPGNIVVPKNTSIVLKCELKESLYPSAKLIIRDLEDRKHQQIKHVLTPDLDGNFSFNMDSLSHSIIYSFTLGNKSFNNDTITVIQPPLLYSLQITLKHPKYTGKSKTVLPEGQGALSAFAGTRAYFSVASIFPLKNVRYINTQKDTIPFAIKNGKANGEIRLWQTGEYTFLLEDTLGQKNDSLPSFYVNLIPDYNPNVRIIKPGKNKMLSESLVETLWVEAVDDFGIRKLGIEWQVSNSKGDSVFRKNILPSGKRKKLVRQQVLWDFTTEELYPGDTLFYWARTQDNKPFGKIQYSVSDTFFFRIPTFEEIHKTITKREDDAEEALVSVKEKQQAMKEKLESLMKSAKGKDELSWEEKKIVEDLGKSMKEQTDSLNEAVNALQEAVEKMKESSENNQLVEKMDELQKAIKELIEEYGDSLLFKPQKKDEKLGWDEMKDAVEKMAKMLPELEKQLENALAYLKMLKKENERSMLAMQAKKLAQEQMELAQENNDDGKRVDKQNKLSKKTEDFLKDANKKLFDDPNSPVSKKNIPSMKKALASQKDMQSSLSQQQMPPMNTMNQMSSNLQSMAQELESTLSGAMAEQAKKDANKLLDMAQDAMNISQWQKMLKESMRGNNDLTKIAIEQQTMKNALEKSNDNIDSLKMVPPSILQKIMAMQNMAISNMDRALQSLATRNPGKGMKQSLQGMNALANALLESANGMMQSGSSSGSGGGGGMMGGLKKLSAKQAAINSATSEMLRQMLSQQGKGSQKGSSGQKSGQNGKNAREAAQNAQRQLADQLKKLSDKYGKDSEKSLDKRVKDLEQEARRIAKMLNKPMPDIQDRQDRFLARMLQTTLSLHKQDEGKEERKSSSAVTVFSEFKNTNNSISFDKTDTFYNLRIKALNGNFPDTYRKQVQSYFDKLGKLFLVEKK